MNVMNTTEVQSVVFYNDEFKKWTLEATVKWLLRHGYDPIKPVHRVYDGKRISQYRYRINEPSKYKSFTTKDITNKNIHLILGKL